MSLLALLSGCAAQGCGDLSPEDFAQAKGAEETYLEWSKTRLSSTWFGESLILGSNDVGKKVLRNPQCFDLNFVDRVTNHLNG